MAVTIVTAQQRIAGGDHVPHFNAKAEIVKLSGTIANTDTGTYALKGIPILDAAGLPVILGLPYGMSAAVANGVITFTCNIAAGFTNLVTYVSILCSK